MSLPTEGRAAVLSAFGEVPSVRSLPVPEPEPGAVVVRMRAATVCGSDVHLWLGHTAKALPTKLPLVLGHEVVGEVVALGEGAGTDSLGAPLALGDRIVWTPVPCRRCAACTIAVKPNLCENLSVGMHAGCDDFPHVRGGFSEYVYIPAGAGRARVPDAVDDTWAAAASCAGRSAIASVRAAGTIGPTDHVLVQGAGPLGLMCTAVCSVAEPASLTVVDSDPGRLELAAAWGASRTVDLGKSSGLDRHLAVAAGFDVAFECSGGPGAVDEGVAALRKGGTYILTGSVGGGRQEVDVSRICMAGLRLQGVFSASIDDYWRAVTFMERYRHRFSWDGLFGNSYGLDHVDEALRALRERTEIKPVIVPDVGSDDV